MTLPVINAPTYFIEIPSIKGKKFKFRPFLVKEEKILLIALQENDEEVLFNAIKQIIENCTFKAFDVDKLTTLDLEYIFLQLRKKSKGSEVDLAFKCENVVEVSEHGEHICGHVNTLKFNLDKVEIHEDKDHKDTIMLTETVGIKMKQPTLETSRNLQTAVKDNDLEKVYRIIPQYIDTIFEGETVYDEYSADEFQEFLESLSDSQFEKIQNFFVTMPRLRAEINIKCKKCEYAEQVVVEGLQNFLA